MLLGSGVRGRPRGRPRGRSAGHQFSQAHIGIASPRAASRAPADGGQSQSFRTHRLIDVRHRKGIGLAAVRANKARMMASVRGNRPSRPCLAGTDLMSRDPPSIRTRACTASIPTPRPDRLVT